MDTGLSGQVLFEKEMGYNESVSPTKSRSVTLLGPAERPLGFSRADPKSWLVPHQAVDRFTCPDSTLGDLGSVGPFI